MGKSVSRLYRSTRAVVSPKQPATRNAVKAQIQLMEQITDDDVVGGDETLRNNLRSVYLQSEVATTGVKAQRQGFKADVNTDGMTSDELLMMFYERRGNELQWTPEKVSVEYKVSLNDAENLLRYFNNFVIVKKLPPPKTSPLTDKVYSID